MTAKKPQGHLQTIEAKILKNALEIIHHTGLLKNEMVKLSIGDVVQNGSIVATIRPLPYPYPRGFVKADVILSDIARKHIDEHIIFLQAKGLSISAKSPIFPSAIEKRRYNESELWSHLSRHCIYDKYERNRETGIHSLCWELSKNGFDESQIIDAADQFSRYSNKKRTEALVKEGISRDPTEYERNYQNSIKASGRLIAFHEFRPDKVYQYLTDLQISFDLLFDRDKKTILNKINNGLQKTNKKLIQKDDSLVIEKITGIVIKRNKRSKQKIFNQFE